MNFWKAKIKIIIRWNVNERKWVFTTNSDFIIHISLQPVGVNLSYFKLRFDLIWWNRIHSLKYMRSTTLCCKDIGIRKLEIAAKTQFLSSNSFQAIPFKQFLIWKVLCQFPNANMSKAEITLLFCVSDNCRFMEQT